MVIRIALYSFLLLILSACSSTGGSGAPVPPTELPSNSGPASSYLSSSNLISVESLSRSVLWNFNPAITPTSATTACTVTDSDNNVVSGTCINPINITGYALQVDILDLGGTQGTGASGPARLFAGDTTTGERWGYAPFDFADPVAMAGTPNLPDFNDSYRWDHVNVEANNLDVVAFIKDQYWHIRMVFTSSPVTLETAVQNCGIEQNTYDALATYTRYLSDTIDFYRGDILLCRKDSSTDTCTDTDWQWYDLDSNQFTSTRPSNPLQHDWTANDVSCSLDENNRPSINEGHYDLFAETEEYYLTGEYSNCYIDFTYIDPDTSESSSGNTLSAEFDFDSESSVFLPNISNSTLSSSSNNEILNAFIFKQMYIRNSFDDPDAIVDGIANLTAEPTIAVSQDDNADCVE